MSELTNTPASGNGENVQDRNGIACTYDPLKEFLAHYADAKSVKKEAGSYENLSIEEKLKQRIIDGDKLGIENDLNEALKQYSALDIINTILLDGMKVVGELFGAGEMQLPFVLQSAETMKTAVSFLEPYMEKVEGESSKGVMVLATVKGDVHDIGKNLVDIILTNNGYRVVNLGIKVALEAMLDAAEKNAADAIGMSGLLVKSTAIMKENLELMNSRGIEIPVVLGGAALTRKFVEQDLRALYQGHVAYAQDAFDGLHFMEKLKSGALSDSGSNKTVTIPETLPDMLLAMEKTRKEFIDLLADIPEEEYQLPNAFGKWSLRDVLAHLIGWERFGVERLEKINAGATELQPFDSEKVNEVNGRLVRDISITSKDQLLDELTNVRKTFLVLLNGLSAEKFNQQMGSCPSVKTWLPHFSFAHEQEHMEKIKQWIEEKEEELDNATGAESKLVMASRSLPWLKKGNERKVTTGTTTTPVEEKEESTSASTIPTPPFWGSKVVENIKLEKVWEYLNEVALFRGQWQIRRGKKSQAEYDKQIEEIARPKLAELKLRAKRDKVLDPKVVYGYFPCWSEGNDLVILKPKGLNEEELYKEWKFDNIQDLEEWQRFTFPRQSTARKLCIADFFLSKEEALKKGRPDVVSFTAVTVGRAASEYTQKLFEGNAYADYLFMHGLSVETAEALAEYWHKVVRTELGVHGKDAKEITRLFSQGYQGSRYSFGYPACPNLEDQTKLFQLLHPERIDLSLTEEFHLEPEQSTTAIICHNPAAKYFSIK